MTNLEFPNEFAAIAYEFLYFNITIALRMHLRDVQIWRRLPCFYHIIVFSLSQYLEFWGKLFCAILYACCRGWFMLVSQNFMCNTSVTEVNLSHNFLYHLYTL